MLDVEADSVRQMSKSKSSVLCNTTDQYADGATVHGVGYIFNESLPSVDRIIWAVGVCFFFALAIFFTTSSYLDWQENQVMTSLKNTALDVTSLQFPAVTICSEGLDMEAVSRALTRDIDEWKNREVGTTAEYMREKFSIAPDSEISILDVISAMSSSDVDKSSGSNGVRNNQLACNPTGIYFIIRILK
jgi:hypothetical protein